MILLLARLFVLLIGKRIDLGLLQIELELSGVLNSKICMFFYGRETHYGVAWRQES